MCCQCDDQYLGRYGYSRLYAANSLAVTAPFGTALAAGEVVSPLLTFECVALEPGATGVVFEAVIHEHADSGGPIHLPLDLILMSHNDAPAAQGSPYSAPTPVTRIQQVVRFTAADYVPLDASHSAAIVRPAIAGIQPQSGLTTIYGVLIARGIGTYAEGATLNVQIRVQRD